MSGRMLHEGSLSALVSGGMGRPRRISCGSHRGGGPLVAPSCGWIPLLFFGNGHADAAHLLCERRGAGMALDLVLESMLTCPHCGATSVESMPTDACIYFHECQNCQTLLHPKPGDCCVFCSYGSVKCPPIQQSRGCCGADNGVARSSG